jgi:hypothetical protein
LGVPLGANTIHYWLITVSRLISVIGSNVTISMFNIGIKRILCQWYNLCYLFAYIIFILEIRMLKSTDVGVLEMFGSVSEQHARRSLGVMLVFKRQTSKKEVEKDVNGSFDLDDPVILKRWERRLGNRIYSIYGYSPEAGWEFFALLEFGDLEAWQHLQQYLDTSGFSRYYVWDIVALGRHMG